MPNIRQAIKQDSRAIANLVADAQLLHRHLDWTPLLDWVDKFPFLLYEKENSIQSLLACPPDPVDTLWIKCFACQYRKESQITFRALLDHVTRSENLQTKTLYAIGLQEWFVQLLKVNNFQEFQNVIVLLYDQKSPPPQIITQTFIRPMEMADLQAVAELDNAAFEPMWGLSEEALRSAYLQSEHSSVAEQDNKIIAYELSTSNNFSAHLARVAVNPEYQRTHLGSHMISEMIGFFHSRGIQTITVNTQSNNSASLELYRKTGFHPTDEIYPIFRLDF